MILPPQGVVIKNIEFDDLADDVKDRINIAFIFSL